MEHNVRPMRQVRPGLVAFLSILLILKSQTPAPAAAAPQDGKKPPAKEKEEEDDDSVSEEVKELRKKLLDLFSASEEKFEGDRIVLVYDFEGRDENLVSDWKPDLKPNDMRIRWARGIEGTATSVEYGLILGDYGEYLHKAMFLPDIDVEVDWLPVSPHKAGNIVAPVFSHDKKKRAIGANAGSQAVCLAARKHVKPPIPRTERTVVANTRYKAGYTFDGTRLECRMNGRKTTDTISTPKFVEGFDKGRVGLIWTGSIQYFLFKVTIKGKLDPAWVDTQLGTKTATTSKDAAPGAASKAADTGKTAKKAEKKKGS